MQKKESGPLYYLIHRNNSKWNKGLNLRPETINLLEENIECKLLDVS